jgi:hypothetical protein
MRITTCLFVLLGLATACNRDPAVPTAEENRQLDDAANMLDRAPANLENVDDSALVGDNRVEAANTL